jgi:hypothetical protein
MLALLIFAKYPGIGHFLVFALQCGRAPLEAFVEMEYRVGIYLAQNKLRVAVYQFMQNAKSR